MTSAKVIVWLSVISGFGWFSYFAVPVALTNAMLLAQGIQPDWNLKDVANLGGFATFAMAMYFLHRESIKTFRDELRTERETRSAHFERIGQQMENKTVAIQSNTAATTTLTTQINELARELRKTP